MRNLLPDTIEDNLNITQTQLHGYYKNPIIRIEISLLEPSVIKTILKHMLMNLSVNDRAFLALQFKDHIDAKKNLFLRFNKQDAFLGKTSLCTKDPIRVKTKLSFLPTTLSDLEAVL